MQGRTFKGAVGSDVMSNEASSKNEQNHEQFGPGEPTAAHFYLQILDPEKNIKKIPSARLSGG